jgi:WhiB family redox-sensing transcriptional regulator
MDQLIPGTHVHPHVQWSGTASLITPEPWMQDARCAETDPEIFFPEKGGSTKSAKRVCAECTVRVQCLAFALRTKQDEGIWGGKSALQLKELRKDWAA